MATSIATLRAVLHPTRRRMVEYLLLNGPTQVGTLARELGEQVGSVSHHLRMLERVEVVARVPELETDGRTSFWRLLERSFTWSAYDFDEPAHRIEAKAAERANIEHQFRKLAEWKREADKSPAAWRTAAFTTDFTVLATPEELAEIDTVLLGALQEWRARIQERIEAGDGQEREPVFVFLHGFRSRP